jgi:hypothetical protein
MPLKQLLLTGVSDNVGGVKRFLSTLWHALGEERHFALVEKSAVCNQGSVFNQLQVRMSVRPMHLFGPLGL